MAWYDRLGCEVCCLESCFVGPINSRGECARCSEERRREEALPESVKAERRANRARLFESIEEGRRGWDAES